MSDHIRSDQNPQSKIEGARFAELSEAAPKSVTIPYRANLLGNIEQALKGLQGYGIMALELIQNADDAGANSLSFDARDDALVVGNEGEFTSCGLEDAECPWTKSGDPTGLRRPCNFHAIAEMGSRSKLHAPEQTGRFGIGFVSVYQITDTPIVRSSGVELRLNPQTQEVVKSEIARFAGTQFVLPWAAENSEVRAGLNASPTPVDVADKVVAEIDHVLEGSLLFLRHIQRVELRRNGRLIVSVEIDRSAEAVTLRFDPSGHTQRWLVLQREADDVVAAAKLSERFDALARLDRSMTVSVAVPLNLEQIDGLLYAYLPTRQSTGMPVHVNADFFPHASRQAIVLEGEQHDRYWNEALIETAAAALADNFVRIRDLLGSERFWALAEAAFHRRSEPAFKPFWDRLGKAATEAPSIWTTQGEWRLPKETALPPDTMTPPDQAAIAEFGLALIHPKLRRHWTVLSSIGVQHLRLANLVAALDARADEVTAGESKPLRRLWSAIELLIDVSSDRAELPMVLAKLKAISFMLDADDQPISPNEARRLPASVSAAALRRTVPNRILVNSHILSLPHLSSLVAEYLLDDLASDLADVITDDMSATAAIGDTDADARRFYSLLTSFPTDRKSGAVSGTLAEVPMLRTGTGFVSPSRGQLPGDFRDPIGHFQIIDTRLFVTVMMDLARDVLQTNVLTFRDYVEEHLEQILAGELTRQQYGALLTEILNHRSQLDEDGTLAALAGIAFVRTRAGEYARPNELYFWSAPLAAILGEEPARWVDETWLPSEINARSRDLFERLGMPITVAAEHIVERINTIAEAGNLDNIVAGTTPIIRYVLERWTRFDDEDRIVLSRLREVKFLSAIVDGERKEGLRYSPRGVYRAGRATGFASQVPVVEMTALRQSTSVVTEFLDLIELPAEPPTEKIVAHLEHCMSSGTAVNDLTYQMLSERLERSDNAGCIDRLEGTDFIYFPDVGFIGAGEVFWIPPAFGGLWHTASARMRQRDQLYRRLGVADSPEPRHFAALALRIAGSPSPTATDIVIHSRCLAALAEALEREDAGAAEAVDLLSDERAFLAVNGDPISTRDAIWLDSEQLAAPFGSVLDDRIVRLTDLSRSAAIRFLFRLDVPALTDIARFRLADEPDGRPAIEATSLLQSRADLILWLAPNRATRQALIEILQRLDVSFSAQLMVHAEIDALNPPVRSPASSANAYLDREAGLLHVRSTTSRVDWAAAFRVVFSEIERFCPSTDIPPLCLTAAYIMSLEDRTEAEQALLASDFKAPADDNQGIQVGRELEDEQVETSADVAAEIEVVEDGPTDDDPIEDINESTVAEDEASSDNKDTLDSGSKRTEIRQNDGAGWDDKIGYDTAGDRYAAGPADDPQTDDDVSQDGENDDVDLDDEAYGSASGRGAFGADPGDVATTGVTAAGGNGRGIATSSGEPRGTGASLKAGGNRKHEAIAENQVRRSRMLSYVLRSGPSGNGDAAVASAGDDISKLIDAAAIKAALSYEQTRGWAPEQQPHFNPGFDIVSRSPSGSRRLIEVKGLESDWTERGIKLSHVQFAMAREHLDEFWIYVIEHARDMERQRVSAICNPFGKVEEYWFDHNWRQVSEERASSRDIHLRVGLKVEHHLWGKGVVTEIDSRGAIPFVVVDFGTIEGRRGVPFNSSLKVLG
ncbi:uncharacterized protein DUF3883 [Hoeflea marina]|uniref:Uncharacterized protein DUF3883 n=1 Tax=Hoeflea marina TaxID=274592 RepID=A0A317PUA4_9HYPH|nr:DUF3883 domain-containing protein [Hoeflea marina]PWW03826.1 uncharacterized protein DUF3883 [Hoeflea marina]